MLPKEVRGRDRVLARRDRVAHREHLGVRRNRHVDDDRAKAPEYIYRSVESAEDVRLADRRVFPIDADRHALDSRLELGRVVGDRATRGRGVFGVVAGEHLQRDRAVGDGAREGSWMIERIEARKDALEADATVG